MIKIKDLHFCGPSVVDTFGRVFEYGGGYYRMIYKSSEVLCRELLESELFQKLIQLRFIPNTYITDEIQIEGNPLVLKHETCYISKPNEWSFEMFKDAAIHILKVNELCNQYGYELKDAHPFNVTFHKGRPVFFDIGSIIKRKGKEWVAKEEFLQKCYLLLLLWVDEEYSILRNILDANDMFSENRLLPRQSFLDTPFFRQKVLLSSSYQIHIRQFRFSFNGSSPVWLFQLVNRVSNCVLKKDVFHITCSYGFVNPTIEDVVKLSKKNRDVRKNDRCPVGQGKQISQFVKIVDLIKAHCSDARSAVDLSGNIGSLSVLLHQSGQFDHVFVINYDGTAVDRTYLYFKENELPIDVLYSNIVFPFDLASLCSRVQSDIAIACTMPNRLVLQQGVPLYAAFERFSLYTNKYIVVEYEALGVHDGQKMSPMPEWYTEGSFKRAFEEFFVLIHREELETNRIVYIGEKRKEMHE